MKIIDIGIWLVDLPFFYKFLRNQGSWSPGVLKFSGFPRLDKY
jgi:hypothetical protein